MKIQTSIEFLLILSAISILSLGLVSAYKSSISSDQYAINSVMQNSNTISAVNSSTSPAQDPGVFVNVPINSTTGMQNTMQVVLYGCMNGTGSVRLSSNNLVFSQNDMEKIPLVNLVISSIAFDPISTGLNQINVNYSIACGSVEKSGTGTFVTYSTAPSNTLAITNSSSAPLAAYISKRNESIHFPITMQENVENLNVFNHCSYNNFNNVYPLSMQCGTSNAWDYAIASDYCYWEEFTLTATYCVVPQNSKQNLYSVNTSQHSYYYSFLFSLSTKYGSLTSEVKNASQSQLLSRNSSIGKVIVVNVSGTADYQMPEFIGNASSKIAANAELYQQYVQARNNMYSMLDYYNNTEVDPSTASSIQQAVAAYETAESNLAAASGQGPQACSIVAGNYTCKPSYPFSYVIDAKANLSLQNQTLYYEGSVINVTGR